MANIEAVDNIDRYTRIYQINLRGNVFHSTVTSDPFQFDSWMDLYVLDDASPIAVAVKTGRDGYPDLIQLCCFDACIVYQIRHCDILPPSIFDLFETHPIIAIRVAQVVRRLSNCLHLSFGPDIPRLEIRDFIRGVDTSGWRIETFSSRILGLPYSVPESVYQSRYWGRRQLRGNQVLFASLEAYVTFRLYNELLPSSDSDPDSHSD